MAPAFPLSIALRSRFFHIVCAAIALVISFYLRYASGEGRLVDYPKL